MLKIFRNHNQKTDKEIYFEYADAMMALCLRYLGNKQDAEETLNNGFLKIFAHRSKFQPESEFSFPAWVKRIMINECLMQIRQKKVFFTISIDTLSENTAEQEFDTSSSEYLLDLLLKLPEGYRTVFNLYAIEGYTHKEISEMLNISENTSRSQLRKARLELQKRISIHNSNSAPCTQTI